MDNKVHFEKEKFPFDVTDDGSITISKEEHSVKVRWFISFTAFGISIFINAEQKENTDPSIIMTEIDFNDEQCEKEIFFNYFIKIRRVIFLNSQQNSLFQST